MRTAVVGAVLALSAALSACSPPASDETVQPPELTRTEASVEIARLMSLVTGADIEPDPEGDERIGCRTDPGSLVPAGPPWKVRNTWWVQDPASGQVAATLGRLESLTAEGFQRQEWSRPDPEPATLRVYGDARGFAVLATAEPTPAGRNMLEVRVTSPCVEE